MINKFSWQNPAKKCFGSKSQQAKSRMRIAHASCCSKERASKIRLVCMQKTVLYKYTRILAMQELQRRNATKISFCSRNFPSFFGFQLSLIVGHFSLFLLASKCVLMRLDVLIARKKIHQYCQLIFTILSAKLTPNWMKAKKKKPSCTSSKFRRILSFPNSTRNSNKIED